MAQEVYRIALPDGQEFAWHGTVEALRAEHKGAQITGRLVMDNTGQGSWEPTSNRAAARKESPGSESAPKESEEAAPKKSAEAKKSAPRRQRTSATKTGVADSQTLRVEYTPEEAQPTVVEASPDEPEVVRVS